MINRLLKRKIIIERTITAQQMRKYRGHKAYDNKQVKVHRSALGSIRHILRTCEDLIYKVPDKEDTTLQKWLKAASLVEWAIELFNNESAYKDYATKNNLVEKRDSVFADIFFTTQVFDLFEEHVIHLDERGRYIIKKYISEEFGALYFKAHSVARITGEDSDDEDSSPMPIKVGANFWHDESFNFDGVLSHLWELFDNKINVQITNNARLNKISVSSDPFEGRPAQWVDQLADKHAKYIKDNIARASLFVGPPGVGKSTLVLKVANKIGARVLRMEAGSISMFNSTNMEFLLGGLKPHAMIIDDVDRVQLGNDLATMFTVLDWMKVEYPSIPLFMTANRVSHLDAAFVRPGRIDEIHWFNLPDEQERLVLLNTYLAHYNVELADGVAEKMAEATDGMAVPWLKEVALQLRYESQDNVLELIESMRKLKDSVKYSYGLEQEEIYMDDSYDINPEDQVDIDLVKKLKDYD